MARTRKLTLINHIACGLGLLVSIEVCATDYVAIKRIDNPRLTSGDFFGEQIAVSGSVIAISSRDGEGIPDNAGEVDLFNLLGEHSETVVSPKPERGGEFGTYLGAGVGNGFIVGAWQEDAGAGRAYTFEDSESLFELEAPISAEGANYGGRVVMSTPSNGLLVGAVRDNSFGDNDGAVHLFDSVGTHVTTIVSPRPDTDGCFGRSAAVVEEDFILIGDACDSTSGFEQTGAAFLFDYQGNLQQVYDNPFPESLDAFGSSVAYTNGHVLGFVPKPLFH